MKGVSGYMMPMRMMDCAQGGQGGAGVLMKGMSGYMTANQDDGLRRGGGGEGGRGSDGGKVGSGATQQRWGERVGT